MIQFKEWVARRDETFAVSPSIIDDEGENPERVVPITKERPGAMPKYGVGDLPPLPGKNCGCKSKKFNKKR